MSASPLHICILGATGQVGAELVRQIHQHDIGSTIIGLANSTGFFAADGLDIDSMQNIDREAFAAARPYQSYEEIFDAMAAVDPETVFVDASADRSARMLDMHLACVERGFRMVTANKNPLSLFDAESFNVLSRARHQYTYNTTVMAGAGAVPYLQDARDIADPIESIEGCFSGTLGFIASAMDAGMLLSAAVQTAKQKGFTEPHPWDDLNGLDVARKLLILIRSAGYSFSLADIQVEPFIPPEFGAVQDNEAFMASLADADAAMSARITQAKKDGCVLRYIASMKKTEDAIQAEVRLRAVPVQSTWGQLAGSANMVSIVSRDRAPAGTPHSITAKGAGVAKTAASLRSDMILFHK
ncbi:MAG: thrA [Candidatus Peribacteria bacterium]|nr:thrA [Candidatus Peribacteria bacterium]